MASQSKAVIKDAIAVNTVEGKASRGEYEIECQGDCVGFCHCTERSVFTISLDAFIQHLHEGRIALV
ncbi:hypothetical protein [Hyphococcus sp.]|uniref:hypothetical protein n=1 Tax=Hyphococcus sp. TaxID=2038636 RepID=UPI00207F9B5B|nr:MAG: hypothetical protein DHS20C04_09850 [Marinicaulis sp.]